MSHLSVVTKREPAEPPMARIEQRDERRFWLCPNCGMKLGEVIGVRVVIQAGGRQVRMPVAKEPEQDCPKCGQASRLGVAA